MKSLLYHVHTPSSHPVVFAITMNIGSEPFKPQKFPMLDKLCYNILKLCFAFSNHNNYGKILQVNNEIAAHDLHKYIVGPSAMSPPPVGSPVPLRTAH